ncbi:hypothetical protein HDU96_003064 [Phlyctochytrium bullatum]|nr:hypothetical protein HDU96_003064 [Phlyctochytrium bullatum]
MLRFIQNLQVLAVFAFVAALLHVVPAPALAANAGSPNDPCASILKKFSVFSAKDALRCLGQFKIDRATRIKQVTALKGYLNLYPYLHLMKTPPMNMDAIKKLDAIASDDSIKSEMEFHAKVSHLVILFRDPHAVYSSACFNNIVYRQPWSLEAVHRLDKPNEQPRIYIRGPISDSLQGDLTETLTKRFFDFYKAKAGIDIRKYRGWEVLEINGKKAIDAIRHFADNYSETSRDPNTRFNEALAKSRYTTNGQLVLQDGNFVVRLVFPWEWETKKTYKLWNPKTNVTKVVTAPWMGIWRQDDIQSSKQYYKDYCTVGGSQVRLRSLSPEQIYEVNGRTEALEIDAAERAEPVNRGYDPDFELDLEGSKLNLRVEATADDGSMDDDDKWGEQPSKKLFRRSRIFGSNTFNREEEEDEGEDKHSETDTEISNSVDYWQKTPETLYEIRRQVKPLYAAPYVSSYLFEGGKVGVFKLGTFIFDQNFTRVQETYLQQMSDALEKLKEAKVKKVILDFSGNGGGFTVVGVLLLKALFPTARFPRFDIRLSKEHFFLLSVGKNVPQNSFNLLAGSVNTTRTLGEASPVSIIDKKYINFISRGGVVEPYSGPFEFNPIDEEKFFDHPWQSKDFAVLTNGLCGSTCGLLSRALRNSAKVKHFVYGGFTRRAFQPSAFEAGNVITLSKLIASTTDVLDYAKKNRIPVPPGALFPQPFPLPVEDSQMLMWESYSSHGGNVATPDEYIYTPSDGYIQVERPAEIVTVYEKLAKMLVKNGDGLPPPATSAAVGVSSYQGGDGRMERWGT